MQRLFSKADLYPLLESLNETMRDTVEKLSRDEILGVSEDDLVEHLVSRYTLDLPELHRDEMYIEEEETKIDVSGDPDRDIDDRSQPFFLPGVQLQVGVPFSGDARLFEYRPSQFNYNPPLAEVSAHELRLVYDVRTVDSDQIRSWYERVVSDIEQWLGWMEGQINHYNAQLPQQARQFVMARRERILAAEGAVAAVGLPVRRRADASSTYVLPNPKRKKKKVAPQPVPREPFEAEPELDLATYNDILSLIEHMTSVVESSPHAFAQLDEEGLRTHLLVPLNSHFEGGATAETFNYEGKTDILIKHNGRIVFVAECKIWKGPHTLTAALDQIRGYLSWRNTKAAVILFVRNRDFSAVVDKIVPTVEAHPGWKRTNGKAGETAFRFVFGHRDDANREIILSVILLAVPSSESITPQ